MKRTIMLVCAAGMSTSLLVTKMKQAAQEKNVDADIFAVSASEADGIFAKRDDIDVLLLGPQVRFMKGQFETKLKSKNIPVEPIDMRSYGMMDGKKVLEDALKIIENK